MFAASNMKVFDAIHVKVTPNKKSEMSDFFQTLYTYSRHKNMAIYQVSVLGMIFRVFYGRFCEVLKLKIKKQTFFMSTIPLYSWSQF